MSKRQEKARRRAARRVWAASSWADALVREVLRESIPAIAAWLSEKVEAPAAPPGPSSTSQN